MQYNTLTRCAVCVCVTSALLLACVKVVMHFASSVLRRLGLVSDSCRVALGLRVFPRLTLTVRASDVALTDYAIDVLSGLIAPYCALRITAVLLTAVEVEVAVTELLRGHFPSISIEGPLIVAAIQHSSHWSAGGGLDYAAARKHAMANYLTSILDKAPLKPNISWVSSLLDSIVAQLNLEVTGSEIRVVDDQVGFALGIQCKRFSLCPGQRTQDTLYSIARTVDAYECTVYLNPNTTPFPNEYNEILMTCAHIHNVLEFPDIWGTLQQPGQTPLGRGKRIKLAGHYYHCVVKIHEEQMSTFLNSFLKCIGIYEYYPFLKHCVDTGARLDRSEATVEETVLYCADYQLYLAERDWRHRRRLLESILAIESNLSLSCIMSLRRQVRDWAFDPAYYPIDTEEGDETAADNGRSSGKYRSPKILEYSSADEFDDHAMSNYLCDHKPMYDEAWAAVREVLVEITAEGLIFSIFDAQASPQSGDSNRRRRSSAPDPHTTCRQYGGGHWGLLSGNTASASVLVLNCMDENGIYCGASTPITREPQVKWVEINGTLGEASLEYMGPLDADTSPLHLLQHDAAANRGDTIVWSVNYDSQGNSYYSLQLADCCVNGFYWRLWAYLYGIIIQGVTQSVRDPSLSDVFPLKKFEVERNMRDPRRAAAAVVTYQPTIKTASVTEELLLKGLPLEFVLVMSSVDVLLNAPVCVRELSAVAHRRTSVVSPLLFASLSGKCVFSGEHSRESISTDVEKFRLCSWNSRELNVCSASNFYSIGPGSSLPAATDADAGRGIFNIDSLHVNYMLQISELEEHSAVKLEAGELVSSCWNGKIIQRVNLRFECEDYFNALDTIVFNPLSCRAIVMMQVQIHRKIIPECNETGPLTGRGRGHRSSGSTFVSNRLAAPSTHTLKHTFYPFEDNFTEFEFLTSHMKEGDDCDIIVDLFLVSEQLSKERSRTILGTVSTTIVIPAVPGTDETHSVARRLRANGVCETEFVIPVRKSNGETSSQFIRLFQELTYPVLKLHLRSLKCLLPIDDSLELNGVDDLAKSIYIKVSVPNRVSKARKGYRDKKQQEESPDDSNAKYYDEQFVTSGATTTESPFISRTSKSCPLHNSEGDIIIDDVVLLPAFNVGDEYTLLIELVAEGEFYSSVVGSLKYCIKDNSAVQLFEDQVHNLRDSNKLTTASLLGHLAWVDVSAPAPPVEVVTSQTMRKVVDKEVSVFVGNLQLVASLSRMILLNDVMSALLATAAVAVEDSASVAGELLADVDARAAAPSPLISLNTESTSLPEESRCPVKWVPYLGKLVPLFGEYRSDDVKDVILKSYKSILELVVKESPLHHNFEFWEHFLAHTGCTDKRIAEYMYNRDYSIGFLECVRTIQLKMVTGFKNYLFAEECWRYVVTPSWLGIPKFGSFKTKSQICYLPMGSPVLPGYRVFVDDGTTILSLDAGLSAMPLNGIMTARADRTSSSTKLFEFEVSGPCTVMLCWDIRTVKLPMWLMNFGTVTGLYVTTSTAKHVVYCRHMTPATVPGGVFPAKVLLGGCGLYGGQSADNYFILISRHTPHLCSHCSSEEEKGRTGSDHGNTSLSSTTLLPFVGRNVDDYRWMLSASVPVSDTTNRAMSQMQNGGSRDVTDTDGRSVPVPLITRLTCSLHVDDIEACFADDILFRSLLQKNWSSIDTNLVRNKEQFIIQVYQLNCDLSWTNNSKARNITTRPCELRCDIVFDLSVVAHLRPASRSLSSAQLIQRNVLSATSITCTLNKSRDTSKIIFNMFCTSPFSVELSAPMARVINNFTYDIGAMQTDPGVRSDGASALIAMDTQVEISRAGDKVAATAVHNPVYTPLGAVRFINSLGVAIHVIVRCAVPVVAITDGLQFHLNPNEITSDSLSPIALGVGAEVTVSPADDVAEGVDLAEMLKFEIIASGWSCLETVNIYSSGNSFYRIEPNQTGPETPLISSEMKRRETSADTDRSTPTSSDVGVSVLSTIGRGTHAVTDCFDDSETWRSCSSDEEGGKASVGGVAVEFKKKSVNGATIQPGSSSDDHRPSSSDAVSAHSADTFQRSKHGSVSQSKSNPVHSMWTFKRKKAKPTAPSPYAIEAEYVSSSDNIGDRCMRKVTVTLRTNIYLLVESLNEVEIFVPVINQNTHCSTISPAVNLRSLQRTNVPLDCLRAGILFFRRRSPMLSSIADGLDPLGGEVRKVDPLNKVAIRKQAFDPRVSSALRTSQEIENSSVRFRPKNFNPGGEVGGSVSLLEETGSKKAESTPTSGKLLEWEIVIYPMLKIVNALPCDIIVHMVQPPKAARKRDNTIGHAGEGARDFFYLPTEFDRRQVVEEADGWRAFSAADTGGTVVCNIEIKSGSSLEIPNIDLKKTIYFRILIPGSNLWSKGCAISSPVLNSKYMYSKHKSDDLSWSYLRTQDISAGVSAPPQVRFRREWTNLRTVVFFSEYWIVNKTGVNLHYDSKFLVPRKMKLGDLEKEAQLKEGKEVQQAYNTNPANISVAHNRKKSPSGGVLLPAVNVRCRDEGELLIDEINNEVTDKAHINFFGNRQIPVMMSCPGRKLRIMPLGNLDNIGDSRICVYDLECGGREERRPKYRIFYDISKVTTVYGDRQDILLESLPECLSENAADTVYIQTIDADRSAESSNINFLTFKISGNGFVYVGIDAKSAHPLSWMKILGFRDTLSEVRTNHPRRPVYRMYKKFYRAHSIVHLGGCHRPLHLNNAAKMYIVSVVPSCPGYFEPTVEDIYHYDPDLALSWIHSRSSNCRQFPRFRPGESVFTDTDYRVTKWSKLFDSVEVLAIQTANRDKSSTSPDYLSFHLKQPSRVFLCIDILLLSGDYPNWIENNGYERMPLFIKTEQSSFHVFSQSYGAELCFFGGIDVPSESYICNYFILITDEQKFLSVWDRLYSPSPRTGMLYQHDPLGIRQSRSSPSRGISSHDLPVTTPADQAHSICRFWDNGECAAHPQKVPFSSFDRSWSTSAIDLKRGNAGEIVAANCVFAARVTYLPGIFNRTCLVTLLPRFIVQNNTDFDLKLLPFEAPSPTGFVGFNSALDMILRKGEKSSLASFLNFPQSEGHRTMKRWMYVYDADFEDASTASQCTDDEDVPMQPICADDIGDQFTWMKVKCDAESTREVEQPLLSARILSVSVVLAGQTVALTIRDVSKKPPFRIENRLTTVSLQLRQKGCVDWIAIGPRSWRSFIWSQYNAPKLLEVKVVGSRGKGATYSMDKIGRVAMFQWSIHMNSSGNGSSIPFVGNGSSALRQGHVQGYIYADGTTRVLSLCEIGDGVKYEEKHSFAAFALKGLRSHESRTVDSQSHTKNRRKEGEREPSRDSERAAIIGSWADTLQKLHAAVSVSGVAIKLVEIRAAEGVESGGATSTSVIVADDLIDISFEHVNFSFKGPRYKLYASIFHIQVDDMRKMCKFPVVLSPVNSGFNSHLCIDLPPNVLIPQFELILEWAPNFNKLIHVKTLDIALQPLSLRVDMDFIVQLVKSTGMFIQACEETHLGATHESTREDIERMITHASLSVVREQLLYTITSKVVSTTQIQYNNLVYVELLHFSTAVLQLEIYVGKHLLHSDTNSLDNATALGYAGLGGEVSSFLSGIIGSIGHVSPTLKFDEILVSNYFGTPEPLHQFLYTSYKRNSLMQSYKVFGSMEVLGDPLSLVDNLGAGVVQFFSQTRAEVVGDSRTRGEGLRRLARAVVGGAAGSTSKLTGSLADILGAVSFHSERERLEADKEAYGRESPNPVHYLPIHLADDNDAKATSRKASPQRGVNMPGQTNRVSSSTISSGLRQGGDVMVDTVVAGLSGLVEEPVQGMHDDGVLGAAKGVAKGIVKVVASPLVGILGAVSVVTESVEMSTRYRNGAPVGRRHIGSANNSGSVKK